MVNMLSVENMWKVDDIGKEYYINMYYLSYVGNSLILDGTKQVNINWNQSAESLITSTFRFL